MTKKIFKKGLPFLITLSLFISAKAQVGIDTDHVTNASVLMEFSTAPKGILLPWVNNASAVTAAVPGTFIFDTSDKKVKYLKGGTLPSWIDLSIDATGTVDTSLQNSLNENNYTKVIIGAPSTAAPGVLVLESQDKALVLPKVDSPYLNIISPDPGLIVYDSRHKQLAVFNGSVWSFWKS